jgi:dienelactone hydrolase
MPRIRPSLSLLSLAAFAAFLLACVWLASIERGGPPHSDLVLEGGVPGTLYLPASASSDPSFAFTTAPAPDARPPAIVLVHGFSADRVASSGLARRLALSGYAVLAIDVRGHGQNRNPFPLGRGRADYLAGDLAAAVDFLRTSPLVDGSRIALIGHSMGAGAALDFATRDAGIDAVIPISGGAGMLGPQRATNALFLYAERDPERIKSRVPVLAAQLAGAPDLPEGETRGDFRQGSAVRRVEIPGEDHLSILTSEGAVREMVAWLDSAFGREPHPPAPKEARGRVALVLAVLLVLVLPGLGRLLGRIAPATQHLPAPRREQGLVLLALALVAAMPLASLGNPGALLSIEVGDVVVMLFALAGIPLLIALALRDRAQFASLFAAPWGSLLAAALGVFAVYVLLQPLGAVAHRLTLTPERLAVFMVAALGLLPFALAAQMLLRRGPPLEATLYAVAGRVVVVLALVAGTALGVLPPVVQLMIPALVLVFVMAEVLAASLYAVMRNLLTIAVIDAAWLALIIAAIMPVRA